jgi:hypothetical protein
VTDPGRLFARGSALLDEGLLDDAIATFEQVVAVQPDNSAAWYNLGLLHKWQARWDASRECNLRSLALDPGDESSWWNLGIAATALGDWPTARRAWAEAGLPIEEGEGPPTMQLGNAPVRLDPEGRGEVVWAQRIDPVRAALRNIPLPDSGFRWGDTVLHDGQPDGERMVDGLHYSVFNVLERLRPGPEPTVLAAVTAATPEDVDALEAACERAEVPFEDWTAMVRTICRSCSEGLAVTSDHVHPDPDTWEPERTVGLAAERRAAEAVLDAWAHSRVGCVLGPVQVPELEPPD